jgi:hypothetical protein
MRYKGTVIALVAPGCGAECCPFDHRFGLSEAGTREKYQSEYDEADRREKNALARG